MDMNGCINLEKLRSWMIDKAIKIHKANRHDMSDWEDEQRAYYDSLSTPESNILFDLWSGAKRVVAKAFHRLR